MPKPPCLGLRITKSGVKSFIFETWFNSKLLRSTIADASTWSIAQAQAEARRIKVLTDQGIDPRETKEQEKVPHRARNIKSVAGLIVWQEYINDRKVNWCERHLKDHYNMVRDGGEPIERGLRKMQPPVKQAGILRPLLSPQLSELNREQIFIWLKPEVGIRAGRVRIALSALKALITWMNDHPQYAGLVDANTCDRLPRELPAKKQKTIACKKIS